MGKYKEKVYDIYGHLCLYCLVKNLYEKPLGKTHEGKKSTIYAILGLLIGYRFWEITPPELCKPRECVNKFHWYDHDIMDNL